ncbi:MAG: efflux RND transporter periplasmic adaptor subunit [Muribaculaceae bacterium]|nr:efflux RND transporter periplasmic adaptor subunit [Muribaculaceae bacterium]
MKKFFKILLWVIVALIFIGTFWFLYKNSQAKDTVYEIVEPMTTDIERTTVLTGKIEPRDEIAIKPQISGIISEINVEPGQIVQAGDVIAKIKVIPEASQLSSAENRVNVARINLEEAKQKHERNTTLYDKKVISREEYEGTLAAYNRAREELASAQDAVNIVRQGVSSYNASESNTMVRATITGLVLDVPVKVGSSVIQSNTFNDGTTIATVADMNNLIFKGSVDETEVGNLTVGMPMSIEIGALANVHPSATIEYISPKGTESNGANTFEIKAALDIDRDVQLRAGYSANATVTLNGAKSVLTIPEAVVEFSGDSTFVYCLTDSVPVQKFTRRAIVTGISDGINIEVKSGIDAKARLRAGEKKQQEN